MNLLLDELIVCYTGTWPDSTADALEGKVPELHVIGDSTRPAKVIEAVYDGSRIARFI